MIRYIVLLIFCISMARFTHHQTRGFRVLKITNNLSQEPLELTSDNTLPVGALDQRYFFLSRGLQSFVFASEDGQYVIKFFNNHHDFCARWWQMIAAIPSLRSQALGKALHHQVKQENAFASYQIAHNHLKEETGLLYTHLSSTEDLPSTLVLVDCLNIEHVINPNRTGFILQKRCQPFYPTLQGYIEAGQIDEAKRAIDELIDLFLVKYQKGIADNDPLIRTNYGFLDGHPVQLDVGPLSLDPTLKEPEVYLPELQKTLQSLKNWLSQQAPQLCESL